MIDALLEFTDFFVFTLKYGSQVRIISSFPCWSPDEVNSICEAQNPLVNILKMKDVGSIFRNVLSVRTNLMIRVASVVQMVYVFFNIYVLKLREDIFIYMEPNIDETMIFTGMILA